MSTPIPSPVSLAPAVAAATAARDEAVTAAAAAVPAAAAAVEARDAAVAARAGADGARDAAFAARDAAAGSSASATTAKDAAIVARDEALAVGEKPGWAGKISGWPDPFFRRFDLKSDIFLGRYRWFWAGGGATHLDGWTLVPNTHFTGKALRRNAGVGQTIINGPSIWLDEMGAEPGDTITVYGLFVGTDGSFVYMPTFFVGDNDGVQFGAQTQAKSETGVSGIVASAASPKWLRLEAVVPAGATRLAVYPYTPTAGATFDFLALWAFKGSAASGPRWPAQDDLSYFKIRDAAVATLEGRDTEYRSQLSKVFDLYTATAASAEAVPLDVTAVGSVVGYGPPFSGWGEKYAPAGVSFNAIRVKSVRRHNATPATLWETVHVVVRTGANSHVAGGTVVAIGSVRVPPSLDTLTDLTIVLKDPITGAVKTLSDASFSGGEYFVGVYAKTATGANATIEEHRATQANSLGRTYYITGNDGRTGAWSMVSNAQLEPVWQPNGVQHLLLTNPVESSAYLLRADFSASVRADVVPDLVLPPTLNLVVGREGNVYFDNLVLAAAEDFLWDVSGTSLGQHQAERWTLVPGAAANGTFTVSIHRKDTGAQLATASAALAIAAAAAGTGVTLKALFIGDSLTDANPYGAELLNIAAADPMKIELLGTLGAGANKHEGRPGWTITRYTTNYAGNPFWINGAVDFPAYLANNAVAVPDWVGILLGINDVTAQTTDAGAVATAKAAFDNLDVLIASIKAAGASVKVALLTPPPPPSSQDAFGVGLGTGQTRWRHKRNILVWNRELIARYRNRTAERIYIVPTHTCFDSVHGAWMLAEAPVNSRSTVMVQRQQNGVHPGPPGYLQIADAIWAFLKGNV